MAASRIKGITVEIGGDVTGLEKALKSVLSGILPQRRDTGQPPRNYEIVWEKKRPFKSLN